MSRPWYAACVLGKELRIASLGIGRSRPDRISGGECDRMAELRRRTATAVLQLGGDANHAGERCLAPRQVAVPHRGDHHRLAVRGDGRPPRRRPHAGRLHPIVGRESLRDPAARRHGGVAVCDAAVCRCELPERQLGGRERGRRYAACLRLCRPDDVLDRCAHGRQGLGVQRRNGMPEPARAVRVQRRAERDRVVPSGRRRQGVLRDGRERPHRRQGWVLCASMQPMGGWCGSSTWRAA